MGWVDALRKVFNITLKPVAWRAFAPLKSKFAPGTHATPSSLQFNPAFPRSWRLGVEKEGVRRTTFTVCPTARGNLPRLREANNCRGIPPLVLPRAVGLCVERKFSGAGKHRMIDVLSQELPRECEESCVNGELLTW